jgi:hypothetical protein
MIATGTRPLSPTGVRRARWLAVLLLAIAVGILYTATRVHAQSDAEVLVRYTGILRINGRPAQAGTSITVITATRPEDIVVCGTGAVSGGGAYSVDILVRPECAPARHPSPTVPHIFLVNGENVGVDVAESRHLTLADRSGWGRTATRNLDGTDVPGAGVSDRLGAPLPAVRYHGTARMGDRFPRAGTVVRALHIRSVSDIVVCGTGSITDGRGSYVVDVPLSPDCIPARHPEPTITHILTVEGQKAGTGAAESRHLTLDGPGGWGRTSSRNLNGEDIPNVPDSGMIRPPAIRYHGSVRIENQVAPAGTAVTVLGTRGGPAFTCGNGSVTDRQGSYYVDIMLSPDCLPLRHPGIDVNHLFIVNGKRVNSMAAEARHITLDNPVSWGRAVSRDLRWTRNAPDAPPAGPAEPAPPEMVTEAMGPGTSVGGEVPPAPTATRTPLRGGVEITVTPQPTLPAVPPVVPPVGVPIAGGVTAGGFFTALAAALSRLLPPLPPTPPPPPPVPSPTPAPLVIPDCDTIGPFLLWHPNFYGYILKHTVVGDISPNKPLDTEFLDNDAFSIVLLLQEAMLHGAGRWVRDGAAFCKFEYDAMRVVGYDRKQFSPGDPIPDPSAAPPGFYVTRVRLIARWSGIAYELYNAYPIP